MIPQILTIARNTFIESLRQPIFFIIVMIAGLALVLTTWGTGFSMGYGSSAEVSADNKLLLDVSLATVFVCGTLLAAFVATAVVSREIEDRTVLTVVSKPISRTAVVVGKFLGVAAAIQLAVVIMLVFLMLSIRHGVMSNAADRLDVPVVTFGLLAVGVSVGIGIWCNFFYGWVFAQTTMLLMLPLSLIAWVATMLISKEWAFQSLATDFKPQVTVAAVGVGLAVLVLTSVATSVSTRLGQVMTIVVCAGVFLVGLLTNHLLGRHAFSNSIIAVVENATPESEDETVFRSPGDTYTIQLKRAPVEPLTVGTPIYYGDDPNGIQMAAPSFNPPDEIDLGNTDTLFGSDVRPALIVIDDSDSNTIVVQNIGKGVKVGRPPRQGDYIFIQPTEVKLAAASAWAIVPNLHYFWLMDAVTQNHPVPMSHLALIAAYALCQIVAFQALGVILFQKRDVG